MTANVTAVVMFLGGCVFAAGWGWWLERRRTARRHLSLSPSKRDEPNGLRSEPPGSSTPGG